MTPTLRAEQRADRQLGAAVRHADVAHHAAGSHRLDGLVHRLGRADALEHDVRTDAAEHLADVLDAGFAALFDDIRRSEFERDGLAVRVA